MLVFRIVNDELS